jgi:hypothetical protein
MAPSTSGGRSSQGAALEAHNSCRVGPPDTAHLLLLPLPVVLLLLLLLLLPVLLLLHS